MTLIVYAYGSQRHSTYIPKSQRSFTQKLLTKWGKRAQQVCEQVASTMWDEIHRLTKEIKIKTKSCRFDRVLRKIKVRHIKGERHRVSKCWNYPILGYQAVAMSAKAGSQEVSNNKAMFDTDSDHIGIDNRASACMSDDVSDFVGLLRPTNRIVKGFAGSRTTNL